MKKVISMLLAILLMASAAAFGASAEGEVSVRLVGAPQAIKGNEYEVALNAPASIGGMQGTVSYDSAFFELSEIKVGADFASANAITSATAGDAIRDNQSGEIKFALLSDGSSTEWVVLVFKVKAASATSDTTIGLENVIVSDADGTSANVESLCVNIKDAKVYDNALDVRGATVKTDASADIRFKVDLDSAFHTNYDSITELGVIIIPTAFIENGQEITYDADYSGYHSYKIALPKSQLLDSTVSITAVMKNAATTAERLNRKYSARAYVKLSDGGYVYSDNIVSENGIKGGTSSRSCVDVIKAIAAENSVTYTVADESSWTVDEYSTVVNAVKAKLYPDSVN